MASEEIEILRCPIDLRDEALALVLCELAPTLRRDIAGPSNVGSVLNSDVDALFVALRGAELRGAAWGQWQSGNIVVFWPPQLIAGEKLQTAYELAAAVTAAVDETSAELMQVFLSRPAGETVKVLQTAGFRKLADLRYMSADSSRFPQSAPDGDLDFVPYDETQRTRLKELVARSYEGTLDCRELDGARDLEQVITGYQATGTFRPENWRFVRQDGTDVGVLLLADHPQGQHWELMYMALVPEMRGRGWGRQILRYGQWLAQDARVERIVVAVDAANVPAVAMYRSAGFETWEQRAVFVRIPT